MADRWKRESLPEAARRLPPKWQRDQQLDEQRGRCFYCDRAFGSFVQAPTGEVVRLVVHWDHVTPYAYSQNNHGWNFVAACHVCNGIKSDRIFETEDEARTFIQLRWMQKGYA